MSPLARSLLALAAAALLHCACAQQLKIGDFQCTTVMHGTQSGTKTPLEPTSIPAGDRDASITIPNPCEGYIFGEEVIVCDDVKPDVYVPDLPNYSPAIVHRNGNWQLYNAPVYVTFWCAE